MANTFFFEKKNQNSPALPSPFPNMTNNKHFETVYSYLTWRVIYLMKDTGKKWEWRYLTIHHLIQGSKIVFHSDTAND